MQQQMSHQSLDLIKVASFDYPMVMSQNGLFKGNGNADYNNDPTDTTPLI